jgi:hypothetical protein
MTLVNTETGELIERPSYSEVRDSIAQAREAGAKFFEQIVWQIERRAWEVLGYHSWDEMRETEYADMGVVVPRADRPEIVTRMRRVGLTQQEIADTVGVSVDTVQRDLNTADAVLDDVTIETARGPRPATYTKTPAAPAGEAEQRDPVSDDEVEDAPHMRSTDDSPEAVQPERGPHIIADPAPSNRLVEFVNADQSVQLSGWRKNFMTAIAKSGELMLFDPADVAENADIDLINELERLSLDLNKYVARVRANRPHRLTAIKGGAQ